METTALPGLPELASQPPLVVPDPATEPVTVAEVDAEPAPEWDATVAERGNPLPVAG